MHVFYSARMTGADVRLLKGDGDNAREDRRKWEKKRCSPFRLHDLSNRDR